MASVRAVLELLEAGLEGHMPLEQRSGALREFNALIDDFDLRLELVRCEFGVLEPVAARVAADEALRAIRPMAGRRGVELLIEARDDGDFVRTDPLLLRQAILNLLLHATTALAVAGGGRIKLRTSVVGARVRIDVEGVGTAKPGNTSERPFPDAGDDGLGLAICRDAMTLMGGSIRRPSPRKSAEIRFRLSLPRVTSSN